MTPRHALAASNRKRSSRREAPRIGRPPKFRAAMGVVSVRLPLPMLVELGQRAHKGRVTVGDVIRELLGEALGRAGNALAAHGEVGASKDARG